MLRMYMQQIKKMEYYKEGCPGGLTEEQEQKWLGIIDSNEADAYFKKCKQENYSDEYKVRLAKKAADHELCNGYSIDHI